MTQQFVHNVQPGPREFITQGGGQPARTGAANGGHPPTIDSRHLAAPGVPALAHNALSGPEFERQARALVGLIELYANQIAASGTAGPGITVEDLKQLPLARLQALALALPTKAAPKKEGLGEFAGYSINAMMGPAPSDKLLQAFARIDREYAGAE
jgi:hypothetical protein